MKHLPRLRNALGALLLGLTLTASAVPLSQIAGPATAMAHPARSGLADLVGNWYNVNGYVSIPHIVIFQAFGGTYAHNYGACTPSACDWGTVQVKGFNAGFDTYVFNFAVKRQTIVREGPRLRVITYTHFTDGSGRTDYTSNDLFYRLLL